MEAASGKFRLTSLQVLTSFYFQMGLADGYSCQSEISTELRVNLLVLEQLRLPFLDIGFKGASGLPLALAICVAPLPPPSVFVCWAWTAGTCGTTGCCSSTAASTNRHTSSSKATSLVR
jgi:DNA-binding LytR/AlgR family response regulator